MAARARRGTETSASTFSSALARPRSCARPQSRHRRERSFAVGAQSLPSPRERPWSRRRRWGRRRSIFQEIDPPAAALSRSNHRSTTGKDHEFSHYSRATESLLLPATVWGGRRRAQEIFTYSPSLGRIEVFANISCACRPQLSSLFTSGPSTTSIAVRVSQSGRAVEAAHSRM